MRVVQRKEQQAIGGIIETYCHDGRIGVLAEILCETDFVVRNEEFKQLAHDIAMQIVAMNPSFITSDSIPAEEIEKEKASYLKEAIAQGKPEKIAEKIADGKIQKYFSEVCLLNQAFIKDSDKTIQDLINEKIAKIGEKIVVSRFARFELGE